MQPIERIELLEQIVLTLLTSLFNHHRTDAPAHEQLAVIHPALQAMMDNPHAQRVIEEEEIPHAPNVAQNVAPIVDTGGTEGGGDKPGDKPGGK